MSDIALTKARDKSPPANEAISGALELTVVVPTFNERGNVAKLIEKLDEALQGVRWEAIFVDDNSPDGTANAVREVARSDTRIRCIQRIGRRGLSSACVEGILASAAPYAAVIDGDMQHDESVLPKMLSMLKGGQYDIVIGSRYIEGGGTGEWEADRLKASKFATKIAQIVTKTTVSDPMSGFFMIGTDEFRALAPRLSAIGFKILLDILASAKEPLRVGEAAYVFRTREVGESKLDFVVLWEYGMLLADKMVGRVVPVRLISFGIVGGLGVFVHLLVLALLQAAGLVFIVGHIIATFVAMTFNFLLNNLLTYSNVRLKGHKLFFGWISFILACSLGAAANVGVAGFMFDAGQFWGVSALAGIAVGTVWNFVVTSAFTWKR